MGIKVMPDTEKPVRVLDDESSTKKSKKKKYYWVCGVCGNPILRRDTYCHWCRRNIDWS